MFDGTLTAGAVWSTTVTVNDALATLPCLSVAVQVTAVSPIGNVLPEAGAHDGVTAPSTVSVAVAVKPTVAPFGPVASTVRSATEIAGAFVSTTVTTNADCPVWWLLSSAVHTTAVLPIANVDPLTGSQV